MKMGETVKKLLQKQFEPDSMLLRRVGSLDIAFKTDSSGLAISAFVGKMGNDGKIKGDRFVRVLQKDTAGNLIHDHWEGKGRT